MSHHNYFNVEQNNLLSKWLIKLFYNKANSIISVSHGITDFLIRQGINPHKICTIYNPIDIESIKIKSTNISSHIIPTNNYIVSIGRLNKVKNIILMIDAYMIFHQKHPDVKLVIVGDGEERDNIIKHIEAHQIQSHVLLVGSTDNPYPYIYNYIYTIIRGCQDHCDVPSLGHGTLLSLLQISFILSHLVLLAFCPVHEKGFVDYF